MLTAQIFRSAFHGWSIKNSYVEVPARNYINHRYGHRRQTCPVNSVVTDVSDSSHYYD